MEYAIQGEGVLPATIGVLKGKVHIGMSESQLSELANDPKPRKISQRDMAVAAVKGDNGGTTVASTMMVANYSRIKVFATGGIGGVHRESPFDISADLQALADIPMVVVCAGAKAILDLPATMEYLETMGVPVVGYQTDEFPAFYSRESGLKVTVRLDSPEEIIKLARTHWSLGMRSAILVANPVPYEDSISKYEMDAFIEQASKEAINRGKRGQELTPFLLQRISEITGGRSVRTNVSLLLNNARLAAQIAKVYSLSQRQRNI
jgi:pseudouridine-5'-phosphate glycosidase